MKSFLLGALTMWVIINVLTILDANLDLHGGVGDIEEGWLSYFTYLPGIAIMIPFRFLGEIFKKIKKALDK